MPNTFFINTPGFRSPLILYQRGLNVEGMKVSNGSIWPADYRRANDRNRRMFLLAAHPGEGRFT
jgi:hypothetical protein